MKTWKGNKCKDILSLAWVIFVYFLKVFYQVETGRRRVNRGRLLLKTVQNMIWVLDIYIYIFFFVCFVVVVGAPKNNCEPITNQRKNIDKYNIVGLEKYQKSTSTYFLQALYPAAR